MPNKPGKPGKNSVSPKKPNNSPSTRSGSNPEIELLQPEGPPNPDEFAVGMTSRQPYAQIASERPSGWSNFLTGGEAGRNYSSLQNSLVMNQLGRQQGLADLAAKIKEAKDLETMREAAGMKEAVYNRTSGARVNAEAAAEQARVNKEAASVASDTRLKEEAYKNTSGARIKEEEELRQRGYKDTDLARQGQSARDVGYTNSKIAAVDPGIPASKEQLIRLALAASAQFGDQGRTQGLPLASSMADLGMNRNAAVTPYLAADAASGSRILAGQGSRAFDVTQDAMRMAPEGMSQIITPTTLRKPVMTDIGGMQMPTGEYEQVQAPGSVRRQIVDPNNPTAKLSGYGSDGSTPRPKESDNPVAQAAVNAARIRTRDVVGPESLSEISDITQQMRRGTKPELAPAMFGAPAETQDVPLSDVEKANLEFRKQLLMQELLQKRQQFR